MYALLFVMIGCSVLQCDSFRYNSDDYRKRIGLEFESAQSRIIGGEKAAIEEYPFAVSLQNNGTFFGHDVEHFCGGSIIGVKWIITSAQCALSMYRKRFHVRAGTSYYYKGGDIYDVDSVVVHPMFNEVYYDYDFGLVKLSTDIKYDETKQPIRLANDQSEMKNGDLVQILGWGTATLLGTVSEELRHSRIPKISNSDCLNTNVGGVVTPRMFCVFSDNVSPCVGDSGSPGLSNNTLFGVASWSRSCTPQYPSIYASVAEVTNWITEVIGMS